MSPTAPTFVTLNDRLNQAHRRIRELKARETELLAHNRALRAVITELTHNNPARTAAELTSSLNDGSDDRLGIGDQVGSHTSQRLGPAPRSPAPAPPASASASGTGTPAPKRGGPHMFDLDPIGAMFRVVAHRRRRIRA